MKRKTVSLCMIVRDEEAAIGPAIKSALALVDEVVVVDTGSRDNTRIIAEGYGARVVEFSWRDDFAAARNAALEEAYGDWVLVLDADERLQPLRPIDFQRLLNAERAAGYRLEVVDRRSSSEVASVRLVRLFRNQPEIRYLYPIHEQIVPALEVWAAPRGLAILDAPITLLHEGQQRERAAERRERNLRLLNRARQEHPAEPYFDYQLACDSMAQLDGEALPVAGLELALSWLDQAWQKAMALPLSPRGQLAYGQDLAARRASCRLACGDVDGALAAVAAGRREFGDHALLVLAEAAAAVRLLAARGARMAPAAARDLVARTRAGLTRLAEGGMETAPADPRCWTLYPWRYLGELALLEGRVDAAAELYEKALTVDAGFSAAWLGLAECARFAGDRKRALQLYLRAVTATEWCHQAWLRGAEVLEEQGFHDNAASWRHQVAQRFPEHPLCRGGAPQETLPADLALSSAP